MSTVKVLDVTLRDGGCVNSFNFGQVYMDQILSSLESSGVDFIELGYIDEKNGTPQGRTQYCDETVIPKYFLKSKKPGTVYVAMIDYGKFDIDRLGMRTEQGIDGIRLAFHKKNWRDIIPCGRKIINKGYQLYIQPMLTMRYSDRELLELIETVNRELPETSGFYIVDSFGEMRNNDVVRLMHLVDKNLSDSITLGFHSHNNLQLSYSNAISLLDFSTERNLMLDASVMGMGKGAGNLNTELLLEHMNLHCGTQYHIPPLLALIDQVIQVIHKEFYWGYSVEYYLSSIYHCTPSYASHFYNKHMLPIDQVAELLGMVAEEKKISFDPQYAEALYLEYNARKPFDDTQTLKHLRPHFFGKCAVLVAPGKSILNAKHEICNRIADDNTVSISLNNFEFDTDYVFITRADMYSDAIRRCKKVIVPSNIASKAETSVYIINYQSWIIPDEQIQDSSGVIAVNLMRALGVSEIDFAGFDGFHVNINQNYYDKTLRRPVTEPQAVRRNAFYKNFIADIAKSIKIVFLTPSAYQS